MLRRRISKKKSFFRKFLFKSFQVYWFSIIWVTKFLKSFLKGKHIIKTEKILFSFFYKTKIYHLSNFLNRFLFFIKRIKPVLWFHEITIAGKSRIIPTYLKVLKQWKIGFKWFFKNFQNHFLRSQKKRTGYFDSMLNFILNESKYDNVIKNNFQEKKDLYDLLIDNRPFVHFRWKR